MIADSDMTDIDNQYDQDLSLGAIFSLNFLKPKTAFARKMSLEQCSKPINREFVVTNSAIATGTKNGRQCDRNDGLVSPGGKEDPNSYGTVVLGR